MMIARDSCANELLAASSRRTLAPEERQALKAHLSSCGDCRLMADLNADLASFAPVRPGDEAIVAAALEAALSRAAPERSVDRSVRRRRAMPGLLAIIVWVAAGAAIGAGGRQLVRLASRDPAVTEPPAPPPPSRGGHPSATARANATPAISPARAAPAPSVDLARPADPPAPAAAAAPPSAREMLSQGIAARDRGDRAHAVALFRRLQRLHPRSNEARVADISTGQLLLDGGDCPRALAAFDEYRTHSPGGPLIEEALDGRARALECLSRFDEERQSWRELVDRFPRSAYLARARQRLRALQ